MKKKFCLTYLVYIPQLVILTAATVYLFGTAYFSSFQPGSDCSFVPLFVALGIVFSVAAAAVLLNITFKWLQRKTKKKIFLIPCILIDAVTLAANGLIGISLLSDGSPVLMRGIFLVFAFAAVTCMIANFAELFKRSK